MRENLNKKSLAIVIGICLLVPLILAVTCDLLTGTALFLIGIFISLRAYQMYHNSQIDDLFSGSSSPKQHSQDRGKMIFVSLVDENGQEISPQLAEQRIAEARLKAGPKDTVVPIRFSDEAQGDRDQKRG